VDPAGPATPVPTSSGAVAGGRTNGTTGAAAGLVAGWAVGLGTGVTGAGRVSPILGLRAGGAAGRGGAWGLVLPDASGGTACGDGTSEG